MPLHAALADLPIFLDLRVVLKAVCLMNQSTILAA
jgi:hypothetical protein